MTFKFPIRVKPFVGDFDLSDSELFRFLNKEREEIMRLKWIESEKVGYDIGESRARMIWMLFHQKEWRKDFMGNILTGQYE